MPLASAITKGILVTVETNYESSSNNPYVVNHLFSYRVQIANQNSFTVKLWRRHWYIIESDGSKRVVEGEGVVGEQPTLEKSTTFQYISACNLNTEIGKMHGTYLMQNIQTQEMLEITIPEFIMVVPFKLN